MRLALAFSLLLLGGQAASAEYLLEVRELTADNPPFSRNVYVGKPDCTLEQFAALTPPVGFEKATAKLIMPVEITAVLPTAPPGVAPALDLIPEVPGDDFTFVAQLLDARVVGSDPVFGVFVVATVRRDTQFRFAAGQVVHVVTDTDGERYVLQAIALDILGDYDPSVVGGLTGIPLPSGWTYSSEVLSEDLIAASGGLATVLGLGQYATWQRLPRVSTCTPAPSDCRNPLQAKKSRFILQDKVDDAGDRLSWNWRGGPASPLSDFGDPTATDAYRLCVYQDGALVDSFPIAQGSGQWQEKNGRFAYDSDGTVGRGITSVRLRASVEEGKARVGVSGAGPLLALSDPAALTGLLEVQLRNDRDVCWGAVYSPPFQKQDGGRLTALSDAP